MTNVKKNIITSECIYLSHERTLGTGQRKQGRLEDFPVPGITGDKEYFASASMQSPGKSMPTIIGVFPIRDAVRVHFSVNPGNDTFLNLRVEKRID